MARSADGDIGGYRLQEGIPFAVARSADGDIGGYRLQEGIPFAVLTPPMGTSAATD